MTDSPRRPVRSLGAVAPALVLSLAVAVPAAAQSRSLMAQRLVETTAPQPDREPHALRDASLFAVPDAKPRVFRKHDLVQIVVREQTRTESSQELETEKQYDLDGSINAWPSLDLADLLELRLAAGTTSPLPAVDVSLGKQFEGEGEYSREDDFSTRITAEVLDVLPNGNLVLEARTEIQTDEEISKIKVTGVCRGEDVSAANTVLSTQMHDLKISKMHEGELRDANKRGLIPRVLDFLFAF